MPDRHDHDETHPEAAERLRQALASRAASVHPEGDAAGLVQRGEAARRAHQRRTAVLSIAAVVLVAAAVGTALVLRDDDRPDEVAVGDTTTASNTTSTSTSLSTTTTSTTTPPVDDDGVPGWPGFTSRMFSDPQSAAFSFATDVLGFADPTFSGSTEEGLDQTFTVHPNARAGVSTDITVHDTGAVRGWVVTGMSSPQGTIDAASFEGGTVTLSGSATAFEATVSVLVLDQEGNVLAESFTMAGANGEQGPYQTTIDVDPEAGTPFWVMIAEGDASGEGDLVWATTAALAA
jgi:hypothetical protein